MLGRLSRSLNWKSMKGLGGNEAPVQPDLNGNCK